MPLTCFLLVAAHFGAQTAGGTITLHIVDPSGKPVVGRTILLARTREDQPLRTFGFFRSRKAFLEPQDFEAKTGSDGIAHFTTVTQGVSYSVTTNYDGFGPMTYFGAVRAGGTYNVVYRKDCKVIGRVRANMPSISVAKLKVSLQDTLDANMTVPPIQTFANKKTDADGNFEFSGLPPGSFTITCDGPPPVKPYSMQFRVTGSEWDSGAMIADKGPGNFADMLWMKKPVVDCEFRVAALSTVIVDLKNPWHVPLQGLNLQVEGVEYGLSKGCKPRFSVFEGRHRILLKLESPQSKKRVLTMVTVKPGEARHISVTLPKDMPGLR